MKKWILGALVGAIIVFAWQAISWMMLPTHDEFGKYTPAQDQIINTLNSSLTDEGHYMVPTVPRNASEEEFKALQENMAGKPWAIVIYKKSWQNNMTQSMLVGFLIDFVLVILLIYMITRNGIPTSGKVIGASLAAGLFAWLWGPFMGYNWYQMPLQPILGDLLDSLVGWGICGVWLGWWLNRSKG